MMLQARIQVVDEQDALFIVVEQKFDDRQESQAHEGKSWANPGPIHSLTDLNGDFLCAVVRQDESVFINIATGEAYRAVGT